MMLKSSNNNLNLNLSLLVFLAIIIIFYQYVGDGTRPGDKGDSLYVIYVIESFYQNLLEQKNFLDLNYMYPIKNNIFFSETMWGSAYLYSFFRFINLDIFTSYNLYFITISILNFFVSFYYIRKFNLSFFSSIIASFIFAFSLPVLSQDIRPHLNARFYTPPCFYYFYHFLSTKETKSLIISLIFLFFQFLASMYHGVFLSTLLISTYFIYFISKKKINYVNILYLQIFKKINFISILLIIFLLSLFIILFYFYFDISLKYQLFRGYPENHLLHPFAFLTSERAFPLDRFRILPTNYSLGEMEFYMGLFIFPIIFFFFKGKVLRKMSLFEKNIFQISLINVFIYLSIFGLSLYMIIYLFPGFSSIRAPSRSFLITLFPLSIFISQVFEKLKKKWKRGWIIIFFILIFEPVISSKSISQISLDKMKINQTIDNINYQHKSLTKKNLIVFKHNGNYVQNYHDDLYNILASLKLGNYTFNGYTSFTLNYAIPFASCKHFYEYISHLKEFHKKKNILINEIKNNQIKFVNFSENCKVFFK